VNVPREAEPMDAMTATATETLLRRLQDEWMQAWMARDAARLEQLLAPDFALIVSAQPGRRIERPQWLAAALGDYRAGSFDYRDMQVRLLDGFAAVSSVARQQAAIAGVDRSGEFFLVDLWRRAADGRWQVFARYSSHPEAAGASAAAVEDAGR